MLALDDLAPFVNTIPTPIVVLDGDGRVTAANDAARDIFGDWIERRSYITVFRQPGLQDLIERAARSGEGGTTRIRQTDTGLDTDYSVNIARWVRSSDTGPWVVLTFQDVTHVSQAATQRRGFVANVSHELKTPLTALMGFIETLQGPARGDPVASDRFLAMMMREASRMNRLITDLLSLSRVEAQERSRPTEVVDLVEAIGLAWPLLEPRAAEAGVTLYLDRPDEAKVLGDVDQLTQVLTNLVENAIKYGTASDGSCDVRVMLQHRDRDARLRGPAWVLSVIDNGDGIDSIHLPRLTERFYRIDGHRSREKGGTGLGLAIVKHIAQRHRGYVVIDSEQGQGSVFSLVLPATEG